MQIEINRASKQIVVLLTINGHLVVEGKITIHNGDYSHDDIRVTLLGGELKMLKEEEVAPQVREYLFANKHTLLGILGEDKF